MNYHIMSIRMSIMAIAMSLSMRLIRSKDISMSFFVAVSMYISSISLMCVIMVLIMSI